ncbi:hypothetical protein [Nostoc sp. CCY0012]|uniref:hypothetical protein n=1 Tax=Nostoc sp. CCY0012 TaxID=1056123 RepID=UPI0039C651D8
MSKGGRTATTKAKGSNWHSGATTTVRVPIALVPQILEYARNLDAGIALLHGNQEIILNAIDQYIEMKRENYHPNQNSRELNINTRPWDELRKFRHLVETSYGKLGKTNAVPLSHHSAD